MYFSIRLQVWWVYSLIYSPCLVFLPFQLRTFILFIMCYSFINFAYIQVKLIHFYLARAAHGFHSCSVLEGPPWMQMLSEFLFFHSLKLFSCYGGVRIPPYFWACYSKISPFTIVFRIFLQLRFLNVLHYRGVRIVFCMFIYLFVVAVFVNVCILLDEPSKVSPLRILYIYK